MTLVLGVLVLISSSRDLVLVSSSAAWNLMEFSLRMTMLFM